MNRSSRSSEPHVALLDAQWALHLSPEFRRRVVAETAIRNVAAKSYICRKGDPSEYWIGVLEGLVKVASVSPEGKAVSFIGVPAGGWFGEGGWYEAGGVLAPPQAASASTQASERAVKPDLRPKVGDALAAQQGSRSPRALHGGMEA